MSPNNEYNSEEDFDSKWPKSKSPESVTYKTKSKSRSRSVDRSNINTSEKPNQDVRNKGNTDVEPSSCIGVFGLSRVTTEETLQKTFERFGTIVTVKLIVDRFTKESLGYGFINYENEDCANTAIKEANGTELDGKVIRVDYSKTKKAHTPTPGDYKGKVSNNRGRNMNIRNDRFHSQVRVNRNNQRRSRSRSPMMKSFDKGHLSRRDNFRRNSPDRYDSRRVSPVRDSFRRFPTSRPEPSRHSPVRDDYRRYEHVKDAHRRLSPERQEFRRDEPYRGDPRRYQENKFEPRNFNRRISPERDEYRRYSPQRNIHRKISPEREEFRRNSPPRNVHRRFSPNRADVRRYSPTRDESKGYPPRQMKEDFRRYSPGRNDDRRYITKRDEVIREERRRYSPVRHETKRTHEDGGFRRYSDALPKHNSFENSFGGKSYPVRQSNNESDSRNYREIRK